MNANRLDRESSIPIPFALAPLERSSAVVLVVEGLDAEPIDWNNIAPHPALGAMEVPCASCGEPFGEHGVHPPHGWTRDDTPFACIGYRAPASMEGGAR